ncbi:MAG: aminotransferase class V-fold PLP-dependent enzyme [Bacillota bacterium]|nr:aminotransferase class V-fold PLP-dependent enzyme [Bacillota bacterium]
MIYLDNGATSLRKPKIVAETLYHAIASEDYGNPSRGSYDQSLNSLRALMKVRMTLADYFGLEDPLRVVLSPNITYGLNFMIKGLFGPGDHIISSVSEHNSVLRPLFELERSGGSLSLLGLNEDFSIKIEDIEKNLRPSTKAIVITAASNVSGKLTDLKKVHEIARKNDLILVIDGAQIGGCLEFSMKDFDQTIFAFTGHKSLHGPQGTGGVLIKGDFDFKQVFSGGSGFDSFSPFQPKALPELFEPGTANLPSFLGLEAAIGELIKNPPYQRIQDLTRLLYTELKKNENLEFYTNFTEKNAPVVSINIKDQDANEIGQRLFDDYEICVRTGSHCAPLFHQAVGTKDRGIVRLSLSSYNTEEEILAAVRAIEEISKN